jgi:hypothetical protein
MEYLVRKGVVSAWHQYAVSVPGLRELEECVLVPLDHDVVQVLTSAMILISALVCTKFGLVATVVATVVVWGLFSTEFSCLFDAI